MKLRKSSFGKTKDGKETTLYTISNGNGMELSITDYGANIVSILVPDSKGQVADVVLGYDSLGGYEINNTFFGSFIGRHANRIGGASFELNGKTYELEKNDGNNNLHSGSQGYHHFLYEAEVYEEEGLIAVELSRQSPDMEQGFPGNLDLSVRYSLNEANELIIQYKCVSDKDTIVNLTNHSYFNLAGHDSGSILDHKVWIKANEFTPTSDDLIPTGELRDVTGTPMDFREHKKLGKDIDADYEPLKQGGGYDHNFVLDKNENEIEKVGELIDDKSGRKMEIFTDMPGMQMYTANMVSPQDHCKGGKPYGSRSAVCFETQYFPDSCNISSFPSSVLKAETLFESSTVYKFSW